MRQPEKERGMSNHFRNRGPEVIQQSPGSLSTRTIHLPVLASWRHPFRRVGLLLRPRSLWPVWTSLPLSSQLPLIASLPPVPRAREHLLPCSHPFPRCPEPGNAATWLLVIQHCLYFGSCNLLWFAPCFLHSYLTSARRPRATERQRFRSLLPQHPCLLLQEGLVFQQMF